MSSGESDRGHPEPRTPAVHDPATAGRGLDEPVRLTITSETANVAKVRSAVADAAGRVGFDEPEVGSIVLAVDEAVCNSIRHGYQNRKGQPIEIILEGVLEDHGAGLRVTILDRGRQVDPEGIVGRDLQEVRPGGLGTHIINSVMDSVAYARRESEGMQVTMIKMIPAGPRGDGASPCSA